MRLHPNRCLEAASDELRQQSSLTSVISCSSVAPTLRFSVRGERDLSVDGLLCESITYTRRAPT
jgi:hypothetical protein